MNRDRPCGMTVTELVIAMAIMSIVLATVVPLFAGMRNSSQTQQALSETTQNARVLSDHLLRHLAQAAKVVAVSQPSEMNGHIEFEAEDGTICRYDLNANGYVEFGPVCDTSELTGPVSALEFICYDANDLANPTDVVEQVRLVTWTATFRSSGQLTRDRTIGGACYLRSNGNIVVETSAATYDCATRQEGVEIFASADEGEREVPNDVDTPSGALNSHEYDAIELNDGDFHIAAASPISPYAQVRIAVQIDESEQDLTQIAATWNGKGVNDHPSCVDGASLYIWNYSTSSYELLAASGNTEREVTLAGSVTDSVGSYVGGVNESTIMFLVASNDSMTAASDNQLFTDYVKAEVTTTAESGPLLP